MSLYVLAPGGMLQRYPYNAVDLRADNPNVSFPVPMLDERLAEWGVLPVTKVPLPAFDQATQKLLEEQPVNIGGTWTQVWSVVALDADELEAKRQQVRGEISDAVQARLDAFAQSRGYDNIVSACSYATSTHAKYGPEGRYCVSAREATWDALFAIEADVIAGNRPMPAGYEDIKAELPALVWPV